ncbi:TPA: 16S rRNA (cytidine(1402)-2'-O)-methyltransferase [candidate division CPR2 bacterium]|uniref:Ribosomal RNA small subunit methyltransferase I n=1 Tax=candidate division CPR2 bacterium GW2011_GWC1_41_48 TaxID=1618344 RepID=A0A0G0WAM1_UNCC2|nr:MAG: Ribosomal RNA small subunit methyltransferase I [candidate division CPR2 bacterium GW2011_GWC2_39_35]KKS09092.1 MAG: Ribosomal RNA small subunit methyltransferase I [candidate division CPR2 bacterium GW2011_GWC1_41_48]HBG81835.1 16S rRNA (cytidine(1402)-2'-O)-methyltransferase [candidate division CPR2 bacterium]HCL99992.1 16S rRNA (cytidine(1402)-2'-O)-methyltransferase [candidate division CPR2 bacterium]
MKLYIVATPIGNLEDITYRAVNTLKEVDLILAEDTRHAKILLSRYEITTPVKSYHQHSRLAKVDFIIETLKDTKNMALISDAGTPGISDPGQFLIKKILEELPETEIIPIPGPSSPIAALSISGFDTDEFLFLGFLPKKKGRQTLFNSLKSEKRTIVFFESPYRIKKTLSQLQEFLGGDRNAVVCRELTKKFEEIYRGKIAEVLELVKEKGEFVVIISNS